MAVRLRLKRMGRTNLNYFRLCAYDGRTRRDGRAIEFLGWYDPKVATEEKKYSLNADRIKYWLSVGAKPSETVRSILVKNKISVPDWDHKSTLTNRSERKRRKKVHAAKRGKKSGGDAKATK